jgi:hypothetical protein
VTSCFKNVYLCKKLTMVENALSHWKAIHENSKNADARLAAYKSFFADPEIGGSNSWLGLALLGVQDVWSVIRKLSVASLASQFRRMRQLNSNLKDLPLRFMHLVQLSRVAKKSWFAADGLLLLVRELSRPEVSECRLIDQVLCESERVQFTMTHVLELATHDQLHVRTSAIEVLVQLCQEPAVNDTIISIVPIKLRQNLTLGSSISTIEGLLELVVFFPTLYGGVLESQRTAGLALASHEAATVRQRFADFIAKAHGVGIGTTVELLFPLLERDSDISEQWMRVETLLMTLQTQLTSVINQNAKELFFERLVDSSRDPESVLLRLLRAAVSAKFEVRRMGEQVVPLYCQYLVHREPPTVIVPLLLSELLKHARERLCWFLMLRRVVSSFLQQLPMYTVTAKSVVGEIDKALMFHIGADQSRASPLVRIMLACYGPHYFRRLATQADWHCALSDASASSITSRYAPDFALLSSVSVFVAESWVLKLVQKTTPSYEQLLLLEAIRNLIAPANTQHGLLLFTSRDDFRPPSLLDGGDDVPDGFTWLHGMLPILPKRLKSYSCDVVGGLTVEDTAGNAEPQEVLDLSINDNPSDSQLQSLPLSVQIFHPLFDSLLAEPTAEPRVVTVIFSILADLYYRRSVELTTTLRWMFRRLDTLYGRALWVQNAVASASTNKPASKQSSNSFDDSDDDDEMGVAGANTATEIRRAQDFIATLYGYNLVSREQWIKSVTAELPSENSACIELFTPAL